MVHYFSENMWLVWTLLSILCLLLELTSGDLFIFCFAVGAAVSIVGALLGLGIVAQIVLFAVASVLSIFLIRPAALRLLHRGGDHRVSNAEAIIGRKGRVSQTIEAGGYGRVAIDGDDWKALSANGAHIEKGQNVRVVSMDSIILTVEPA